MRINAINGTYQNSGLTNKKINYRTVKPESTVTSDQVSNTAFKGKHDCAKVFAGIAGFLGTAGAVGGMLIMTGGLGAAVLPWIAGYGAASAGAGAILGHQIDKGIREDKDGK